MTSGEINMDAPKRGVSTDEYRMFIKKPITTDALARRIRVN